MARRYIGDAVISVEYEGTNFASNHDNYRGTITAYGKSWKFDKVGIPGSRHAADSPLAYDKAAAAAVAFGSYYTTHNRGDDVPEWAPAPETADAIDEATSIVMDDQGRYLVRRSPGEQGRFTAEALEGRRVRMTKAEAVEHWRQYVLPGVVAQYERGGRRDLPARREAWNNYTDALHKDGLITAHQYNTWTHPPEND